MSTTTTDLNAAVKAQAEEIVTSRADVRPRLAAVVTQNACQSQQSGEGLIGLIGAVMDGRRRGSPGRRLTTAKTSSGRWSMPWETGYRRRRWLVGWPSRRRPSPSGTIRLRISGASATICWGFTTCSRRRSTER